MKNEIAEIEVSYRRNLKIDYKISNSKESFELAINNWDKDKIEMQEEVKIILLNRANKVLGIYSVFKGGITSSIVDIRLIMAVVLKSLATGIIIIHNHPSGNLNPSNDDKQITKSLKEGCKLLNIDLLDHLIICKDGYFSFADEKLL